MNVLIIDDSDIARELMRESLHRYGHRVLTMPSPIGATQTILRESIDVVVIDVNLPTINGDQLAKLFRKQSRLDRVGMVLVSGIDLDALEKLARESQADAVVTKNQLHEGLHEAVVKAQKARR
jgi:CheY-like chemotaxis protein